LHLEVIFGYLDLQWTNYRNLVAVGLLFAMISRVILFAVRDNALPREHIENGGTPKRKLDVTQLEKLAIANGSLVRTSA
jgi:hypothetical protein